MTETQIINTAACPTCSAGLGQPCKVPIPPSVHELRKQAALRIESFQIGIATGQGQEVFPMPPWDCAWCGDAGEAKPVRRFNMTWLLCERCADNDMATEAMAIEGQRRADRARQLERDEIEGRRRADRAREESAKQERWRGYRETADAPSPYPEQPYAPKYVRDLRPAEVSVDCPICNQPAGQACMVTDTLAARRANKVGIVRLVPHAQRMRAYQGAVTQGTVTPKTKLAVKGNQIIEVPDKPVPYKVTNVKASPFMLLPLEKDADAQTREKLREEMRADREAMEARRRRQAELLRGKKPYEPLEVRRRRRAREEMEETRRREEKESERLGRNIGGMLVGQTEEKNDNRLKEVLAEAERLRAERLRQVANVPAEGATLELRPIVGVWRPRLVDSYLVEGTDWPWTLGAGQGDIRVYYTLAERKLWVATIALDTNAPGGLARDFWPRGRGAFVARVDMVRQFHPVEISADHRSGNQRLRWYGVFREVSMDAGLGCGVAEFISVSSAIEALDTAERFKNPELNLKKPERRFNFD